MWADGYYEVVESITSIRITYNYKRKALLFFYLLTFCSCLLASIRIFALKKNFLTSSKHFTGTNLKKTLF